MAAGSQHISDTENSDLLLLTLGLDTSEDDFSKAKGQLNGLKDAMSDMTSTFNLGGFIGGLNKAVQALREAVRLWNMLEDKAIDVSTSRNYVQYDLTADEVQHIKERISADKVAKKYITEEGIEQDLESLNKRQASTVWFGNYLNENDAVAISQAGQALGWSELQGSNIGRMMTTSSPKEVYRLMASAYAELQRKAYASNGEERNKYEQLANNIPFLNEGVKSLISLRTKPTDKNYNQYGNVIDQYILDYASSLGAYSMSLEGASGEVLAAQDAISEYKARISMKGKGALTKLYAGMSGFVNDKAVLPVLDAVDLLMTTISGSENPSTYNEYTDAHGETPEFYKSRSAFVKTVKGLIGSDAKGVKVNDYDVGGRKTAYMTAGISGLDLTSEFALYEAMKLDQRNFLDQQVDFLGIMSSKIAQKEGISLKEAEKKLTDKNSPYYMPIGAQGFISSYITAYRQGLLGDLYEGPFGKKSNTEAFIDLMADVVNNTEHAFLSKRFPGLKEQLEEGEVKATKVSGPNGEFRLRVTIENEKGEVLKEEELTPEQVASLQFRQ